MLCVGIAQCHMIDRCCFYYFVRNSLVALQEALCPRKVCWDKVRMCDCVPEVERY